MLLGLVVEGNNQAQTGFHDVVRRPFPARRSRGQWAELIPVVSALQDFLAAYAERCPGNGSQASLPDFLLTVHADSEGLIPDPLDGGLNVTARRGRPPKVHPGNISLCREEALLDFVRARLDGDSVSGLPLVGELSQLVGKNSGELLGLSGDHFLLYAPRPLFRHVVSQSNGPE